MVYVCVCVCVQAFGQCCYDYLIVINTTKYIHTYLTYIIKKAKLTPKKQ